MKEEDTSNIIFDLTRKDWSYKGILFAKMDNEEVCKDFPLPIPPKEYAVGIMCIIWTDENGHWHSKLRFKFPSGNKISAKAEYGKDSSETEILNELYTKTPMSHKKWYPNKCGTPEGMLTILKDSDMIEYSRRVEI